MHRQYNQKEDEEEAEVRRRYELGYHSGRASAYNVEIYSTVFGGPILTKCLKRLVVSSVGRAVLGGAGAAIYKARGVLKSTVRAAAKPSVVSNEIKTVAKAEGKAFTKLPDGHMWQENSPFKNKNLDELVEMFTKKGYEPRGSNPRIGRGCYYNTKRKRQYHIDSRNQGRYREPNHVDVDRSDDYEGPLDKKRFAYLEDDD
jgi:hypothetical protein